jgi:cell division protein FtsW
VLWVATSAVVMLLFYQIDYRLYARFSWVILGSTVVLLSLVLIPGIGIEVNQSRRWLPIGGGIRFQPSEIAKLAVLLFTAAFLANDPIRTRKFWTGFLPLAVVVLVIFGLTLLEPDLGTSAFILCLAGALLLLGGVRIWYLLGSVFVFAPILAGFVFVRWEMVQNRMQGLLNPESLHQLRHSLRALGSGGWDGLGLGAGMQKLRYLPEAHTDFIFAIIGEELGFIGCVAIILLFVALVWAGAAIAWRARDTFGFLVASGITIALGFQAAINIAVVTGSAPTKGIALPFVTFGGTGLCMTMAQVGILLAIARVSDREASRPIRGLITGPVAVTAVPVAAISNEENPGTE